MQREQVFVAGKQPEVTYVSRVSDSDETFERRLEEYLRERGSIMVVTGPSKSGKTVLLRRGVPEAESVWIPGGRVKSVQDIWTSVISQLNVWTTERYVEETSAGESESKTRGRTSGPRWWTWRRESQDSVQVAQKEVTELVGMRSQSEAAVRALLTFQVPVVIDDFHHIDRDLQREVVEAIKDLLPREVPIIFAAVPHRQSDVVRGQGEMSGRVEQLQFDLWSDDELRAIATAGFGPQGLNCSVHHDLVPALIHESFRSPHLMQRLCLEACKWNEVSERQDEPQAVEMPDDWQRAMQRIAQRISEQDVVRMLSRGMPTKGTKRTLYKLKTGEELDQYPLLLRGIAATGPRMDLDVTDINAAAGRLLARGVSSPRTEQSAATLRRMSSLAKDYAGDQDAVLDYDVPVGRDTAGRLHLLSPFFAFELRWGAPPVAQ